MPISFIIFLFLYPLVFVQAKFLDYNGDHMSTQDLKNKSIFVILGWNTFTMLFIYFGITFSWTYSIIGFFISLIFLPFIIRIPIVYNFSRYWPLLILIIIFLEFF